MPNPELTPKPVVIVFGGHDTTEYSASVASATNVVEQLSSERRVESRAAYLIPGRPEFIPLSLEDVPNAENFPPSAGRPISELPRWIGDDRMVFDLVHGHGGEDGTHAGFFEMYGIRSSSPQHSQLALTMAKWAVSPVAAALMDGTPVKVPQTIVLRSGQPMSLPVNCPFPGGQAVVKPGELGASLFTHLFESWSSVDIGNRVAHIHQFSPTALVQERIRGREFSIGLLQVQGEMRALPAVEIVTANNFFGHEAKHQVGSATETIVEDETTRQLQMLSVVLADRLGIRGWSRLDWIVTNTGIPYFLEINSIPGLMKRSIFPAMLSAAGYSIDDLIDALDTAAVSSPTYTSDHRYNIA